MMQEACPDSRSRLGYAAAAGAARQFIGVNAAGPAPLHASVTFAFRAGRIDTPTCAYASSSTAGARL